jgi:ABC-2 type transport system ATP-binding protein
MTDLALRLTGLTKRYGDFLAVDRLDLAVPRGAVLGFLGPNGAGKTTTIRMALGIYEVTAGAVEVLGRPSAHEVRDRIGYLPEEKGLYKKMKARELVAYFGMLKGLPRAEAGRRARMLLEKYGLGEFTERKCEALSKGMGQKVQVLASIVHEPEFVILDEPFSGLDPVNQHVMEQVIADLSAKGSTIIFSTHVMEHAERLCDRIVLIAKGRKLFDGTLGEAKALLPRRVRLKSPAAREALLAVPGVADAVVADGAWDLVLGAAAAGDVLRACVRGGIEIESFEPREVGLRDVFLSLVGVDGAGEAA